MSVDLSAERNRQLAALRTEINDDPFFGPFVRTNGRHGAAGSGMEHTGYSISATTATHTLDAWIIRPSGHWWPERALAVPFSQIGFSFSYFQKPYVSLLHLLDHLVAMRTRPIDVPNLVLALGPVLSATRGAPLKRNCRDCLLPAYRDQGFAVAPAKLQRSSVVMRIVWVYPEFRETRAIGNYLPVGTLKFPLDGAGNLDHGIFDLPPQNHLLARLGRCMSDVHRANAWQILSEEGRNELLELLRSKRDGGHPRTKQLVERQRFVTDQEPLWNHPRQLALLLRDKGFYSAKTPITQLVYQTEVLIGQAKASRSNDTIANAADGL